MINYKEPLRTNLSIVYIFPYVNYVKDSLGAFPLRAAAFAFFHFEGAAANIIDGFYAVFPCFNIEVEHLPEAVLVGNVEVHGLPLIDMTLAETAGADAPELINGVGVFIQPIGFEREGRGNTGY